MRRQTFKLITIIQHGEWSNRGVCSVLWEQRGGAGASRRWLKMKAKFMLDVKSSEMHYGKLVRGLAWLPDESTL